MIQSTRQTKNIRFKIKNLYKINNNKKTTGANGNRIDRLHRYKKFVTKLDSKSTKRNKDGFFLKFYKRKQMKNNNKKNAKLKKISKNHKNMICTWFA